MAAPGDSDKLTVREASALLGVSGATLRNWRKAGHIHPVCDNPLMFARRGVMRLGERIADTSFKRLRSRANKTASAKSGAPDASVPALSASMAELARRVRGVSADIDAIMWAAALIRLDRAGEVEFIVEKRGISAAGWKRDAIAEIMENWRRRLKTMPAETAVAPLSCFASWCDAEDSLGLLYQALSIAGQRSRQGAFFTPPERIDESLDALGSSPRIFLDPCCGSGRYLLRASARLGVPVKGLYGFDSDPISADLARVNILLAHRGLDEAPEIHCLDSLDDSAAAGPACPMARIRGRVDAIAANPPWGGQLRSRPGETSRIRSGETFSLFLEKSIDLLAERGRLSFLLPESVLSTRVHADVRRLLVERARILGIARLGRCFAGVFTPVVRLDVEKGKPSAGHMVRIADAGKRHGVAQAHFARNRDQAFDIGTTDDDRRLLDAVHARPHQTLKNNAEWALGIVTGDNKNLILPTPIRGAEPIVRGRDVHPYVVDPPTAFVRFAASAFQQAAPESLYRSPEKLVYRFIADRPVFAYDAGGLLTLNSANIVIPRIPGHSAKTCLAFLNSSLFRYLFVKRFDVRKILRRDLETLPFPHISPVLKRRIETAVDRRLAGDRDAAAEADRLVWRGFKLDEKIELALRGRIG